VFCGYLHSRSHAQRRIHYDQRGNLECLHAPILMQICADLQLTTTKEIPARSPVQFNSSIVFLPLGVRQQPFCFPFVGLFISTKRNVCCRLAMEGPLSRLLWRLQIMRYSGRPLLRARATMAIARISYDNSVHPSVRHDPVPF